MPGADWAAVAKAMDRRLSELGLRQRDLAAQAHVSQAIVRELQHNTKQRRRSARTLEALSVALGWHPGHLHAVLDGREPPAAVGAVVQVVLHELLERAAAQAEVLDRVREVARRGGEREHRSHHLELLAGLVVHVGDARLDLANDLAIRPGAQAILLTAGHRRGNNSGACGS